MADELEIRDLPMPLAVAVLGSSPVRTVMSLMRHRAVEMAVVIDDTGNVSGMVRWAEVAARSRENYDAPVSSVPVHRVYEVRSSMSLRDAMELLTRPDLSALMMRQASGGFALLTRRDLLGTETPVPQPKPRPTPAAERLDEPELVPA